MAIIFVELVSHSRDGLAFLSFLSGSGFKYADPAPKLGGLTPFRLPSFFW